VRPLSEENDNSANYLCELLICISNFFTKPYLAGRTSDKHVTAHKNRLEKKILTRSHSIEIGEEIGFKHDYRTHFWTLFLYFFTKPYRVTTL